MSHDRTVLIVDDDEAIRTLLTRVLERASYEVSEATNGNEALIHLRARPCRTVLLDLMMPNMSGFEVINYLTTHDDAGAPCVVVVSAAGERDFKSIRSPLLHSVLRKPFELPALLETLEKCTKPHQH